MATIKPETILLNNCYCSVVMRLVWGVGFCFTLQGILKIWILLPFLIVLLLTLSHVFGNRHALNSFISYYEPVVNGVLAQTQVSKGGRKLLYYDFYAFGRHFQLELTIGSSILSPSAIIEIHEDISTKYESAAKVRDFMVEGQLLGFPTSFVHGDIYEGIFVGIITVAQEQYFVESSNKYFQENASFGSVIFKRSNIKFDAFTHSADGDLVNEDVRNDVRKRQVNHNHNVRWKSLHRQNMLTSYLRTIRRDGIPQENIECSVTLVADHTFYQYVADGDLVKTITDMLAITLEASNIFSGTDFDNDGKVDGICLKVHKVTVWSARDQDGYAFGDVGRSPTDTLQDISQAYDFSTYCLALVFVHRPWTHMDIAYQGTSDPLHVGGICSELVEASFNVAVVSSRDESRIAPVAIMYVVAAHVIGHSFGSPHDPKFGNCSRNDMGEHFLMAQLADLFLSGLPKNLTFSPCSKAAIIEMIHTKGSCLTKKKTSICGNTIVEGGEQCDCGQPYHCQVIDKCCIPAGEDGECMLRSPVQGKKACTPKQEKCCHSNCTLDLDTDSENCEYHKECKEEDEQTPKSDGTPCLERLICKNGKCKKNAKGIRGRQLDSPSGSARSGSGTHGISKYVGIKAGWTHINILLIVFFVFLAILLIIGLIVIVIGLQNGLLGYRPHNAHYATNVPPIPNEEFVDY